jgi:DNA mismatch repair ATPase MutS
MDRTAFVGERVAPCGVTYNREVDARLAAVEEIKESNNYKLEDVGGLLTHLPDLEKGLVRIHYGRVPPFFAV